MKSWSGLAGASVFADADQFEVDLTDAQPRGEFEGESLLIAGDPAGRQKPTLIIENLVPGRLAAIDRLRGDGPHRDRLRAMVGVEQIGRASCRERVYDDV